MLAWVVIAAALLGFGPAPGDAHVLDVPYRNQLDGSAYALANCGPTSLAMVLAYYGIDASPWELRVKAMKAQHSWVGDDGRYSDSYGVFMYNLASVAETITVSPFLILISLCSPRLIRARAENSSPCAPVVRITTWLSGNFLACSDLIIILG